jgi:hypothetical protein
MKDFNVRPFNYLPFNNGDLFDLTCEYAISLLEKLDAVVEELVEKATLITSMVPYADSLNYRNCFWLVDQLLDDYSKLTKCIDISLGKPGYWIKAPAKIIDQLNYNPNQTLQDLVTGGLRNTAQHFEERLQKFYNQMDPLLKLSYKGRHKDWEISFGNGGYHLGGRDFGQPESFDFGNLYFHSYKIDSGNLVNEEIRLSDMVDDILEMQKLISENMEDYISKNSICCPPVRGIGVFMMPHKEKP